MSLANLQYHTSSTLNNQVNATILNITNRKQYTTPKQKSPKKLNILSIDGGGIRAILPALFLAQLEEDLQKESGNPEASIIDYFDLFAGTSAGSILIALYLTPSENNPGKPKFTAKEVLEIYLRDGCKSFAAANPNHSTRRSEKYCTATLEQKLKVLLGENTTLGQLLKPAFFTTYDMEQEAALYFENWNKATCKTWQVVRASAAAPGMFAPAVVNEYDQTRPLIDGSIFASNPAMCAYALASNTPFSTLPKSCFTNDFPTSDHMVLVSLGTGLIPQRSEDKKGSWIRTMMKSLMSSGSHLVNHQLEQLFAVSPQGAYYRFNPSLSLIKDDIDHVDSEYVNALYREGLNYLSNDRQEIASMVKSILQ